MKDILVLRELGQVKALSQPYRIKVLEAFNDESRSAKEISQCLEQPHAKVNYHIKSLEKVGLKKSSNLQIGKPFDSSKNE